MADRSPPDRLNLASFKQRNSAITQDLERQEVERENLWKRLQAARAEGDQLRALAQRSTDEDLSASSAASSPRAIATIHEAPEEEPVTPPREPTTPLEEAPTIAELLTVVSPERLAARIPSTEEAPGTELGSPERPPPPQAVPASSRFGRGGRGRHRSLPAAPPSETVIEGFVCPACFMRAPTQEVLQSHWEAVHQTNSDRFFDGARAAFRRVKRSMSQRPASSKAVATAPPPQIRKAAVVARRHTWEMELVKWRQHALV